MLQKLIATLLMALFTLMSFSAQAGIEKGDKTVSIFGSLTSTDADDLLFLSVAGGMFLTDTLEGQGTVFIIDGDTFTVSSYGGNANLYFPGKNPDVFLYVGGGLNITFIDISGPGGFDETEVGFNVQGGIKQFISEQVTINYQLQFVDAGDYDATILSVGFSIFLE